MNLKLGLVPAIFDGRDLHLSAYINDAHLPPLPIEYDWSRFVKGPWGMDGNGPDPQNPSYMPDGVGNCTVAALNHLMMATSASAGKMVTASIAQIMHMYSAISGYVPGDPSTDNGAMESTALKYMIKHGLAGQKADAYANINIANLRQLHQSIALFGPSYLGVWLSQTDIDDFNAGKGWTDTSDRNSIGGHAVPGIGYYSSGTQVLTWGRLQACSDSWLGVHLTEAHAVLMFDVINAKGLSQNGFKLAQLQHDLRLVTA